MLFFSIKCAFILRMPSVNGLHLGVVPAFVSMELLLFCCFYPLSTFIEMMDALFQAHYGNARQGTNRVLLGSKTSSANN